MHKSDQCATLILSHKLILEHIPRTKIFDDVIIWSQYQKIESAQIDFGPRFLESETKNKTLVF